MSLAGKEERVKREQMKGRKKEVEKEAGGEIAVQQERQPIVIPAGKTLCRVPSIWKHQVLMI